MAVEGNPAVLIPCGIVFLLVGALISAKPNWIIRYQVWRAKFFLKAKYLPSKRTVIITRIVGFFFAALGLFLLSLYFMYYR